MNRDFVPQERNSGGGEAAYGLRPRLIGISLRSTSDFRKGRADLGLTAPIDRDFAPLPDPDKSGLRFA